MSSTSFVANLPQGFIFYPIVREDDSATLEHSATVDWKT